MDREFIDDKFGIVDVKAVINDDIIADIEMQVIDQGNIEKRLLDYWSMMYSSSIKIGDDYKKLKKTIVILFADFELKSISEIPKCHTEWEIREKDYLEYVLTNVFELHIISLPKALKMMENGGVENKKIVPWIRFLTNPKNMEVFEMEDNEAVKLAKEELEKLKQDEHEREVAWYRRKYILEMTSAKDTGIEEGKNLEKIEIAKKLLKDDFPITKIIEITGLTEEEINNL